MSEARKERTLQQRWLRAGAWVVAMFVLGELTLRVFVGLTDVEHGLYQADAFAGWTTAPNLRRRIDVDRAALHFTADTNDRGLRGADPVPEKTADEYRILVLGDSFTWGIGVESQDTFPVVLQGLLRESTRRHITVINAGMPNYGTVQELGFYRGHADELDPDLVVLAYYSNDLDDNLVNFVYADGYLWREPALVLGHPSYLLEFARRQMAIVRGGEPQPAHAEAYALELLERLEGEAEADGRPLFVFEIPPREGTRHVLRDRERPHTHRPLPWRAERSISMFDEVERETRTPYLEEHHLNRRGHRLAAEVLARELAARGALEPRTLDGRQGS